MLHQHALFIPLLKEIWWVINCIPHFGPEIRDKSQIPKKKVENIIEQVCPKNLMQLLLRNVDHSLIALFQKHFRLIVDSQLQAYRTIERAYLVGHIKTLRQIFLVERGRGELDPKLGSPLPV